MTRYLVVAHETVTNPVLLKQVRAVKEQDGEAEFVLLVPATPVRHLLFRRGDERDAEAAARKLADRARTLFAKKGVPLSDVRVGAADPTEAIDGEVEGNPGYAGSSSPPCRRRSPGGCRWICPARSARSTACPSTTSWPPRTTRWAICPDRAPGHPPVAGSRSRSHSCAMRSESRWSNGPASVMQRVRSGSRSVRA